MLDGRAYDPIYLRLVIFWLQVPKAGLGCIAIVVHLLDKIGLGLQGRLVETSSRLPIVMTGYSDIVMFVRALKRGAPAKLIPRPQQRADSGPVRRLRISRFRCIDRNSLDRS